MKILMTWDEVYQLADGSAYGDLALDRKDRARYELAEYIEATEGIDIEETECPEEAIDTFVHAKGDDEGYMFDENGHLYTIW